ncbi:hypothetical protein C8J57DRAFT_1528645 [Mycena rebaudengoi]|nr:hypothetical protein C8J57DRAFT_1528645 [Mycena rebaudengoi]
MALYPKYQIKAILDGLSFPPIIVDNVWIDVFLDAILHVRLPSNNQDMWQDQKFAAHQNTALLDIFASRFWCGETFRLSLGTDILFGYGKPTLNFIDQLIRRCLSWTRRYSELDKLLSCVALPIQKHWPQIAGTRILDLALVMLGPGLQVLWANERSLAIRFSSADCPNFTGCVQAPSAGHNEDRSEMLPWFMMKFMGDEYSTKKLQQLLADEMDGKLAVCGIEAKDYSQADLGEMNAAALARLGNPEGE